jgi:serine/threonine-protein phosphatase 2A regulatory subunit B
VLTNAAPILVDIVSAIEFDTSGEFIAAGDRGGRVVIFEREGRRNGGDENVLHGRKTSKLNVGGGAASSSTAARDDGDESESASDDEEEEDDGRVERGCEYRFFCEFQSHEPEFDYLKSLEIEEKINQIKWLRRSRDGMRLLTTNDKTIKLWKVHQKASRTLERASSTVGADSDDGGGGSLNVPRVCSGDSVVTAAPREVYSNAHAYHINSISLNSDGETYISADDLRINLWNLGIRDQSFNIVDIKPANMEELTEVITAAAFHPVHCNIFMYSSSKGTIKLSDMRQSALCDSHAKVFEEEEDLGSKSFFSEIISSLSDIRFSADGRYILSRDYLTLKLWDINMERKPVRTVKIHDYLRSKLCDLYENDCIFDKFECTMSSDGSQLLTGSYHNYFQIYDISSAPGEELSTTIEASKSGKHSKKGAFDINPDAIDFNKKCLHVAWHPVDPIIAVSANNNLFLYNSL